MMVGSLLLALSLLSAGPAACFVPPAPAGPSSTMLPMASSPQHRPTPGLGSQATPLPPPPPVSMPVWSLSCPVPFRGPSTSMSILTFVTPVSVSSPKLWALSLYKSTLTRCAFLGIPSSGEEYNDIPSIASSVTSTPGFSNNVRRRGAMGEAGVLALGDEAAGWRAKRRAGEGSFGSVAAGGRGMLQLLSPGQAGLVPVLGKRTGWDGQVDKREECGALGNAWVAVAGSNGMEFEVLPNCASYLQVKLKRVTDGGDHDVAICEVIGTGVWDSSKQTVLWLSEGDAGEQSALDPSTALYSGQLREEGII